MKQWKKGIASWQDGNRLYLSVPFTWLVNEAIYMIEKSKKKVIVGGPGAMLLKDKFAGIAEIRDNAYPFEPIIYHNPFATFTTRGCPNRCPFCAVPEVEGEFKEITNFIPRPIVCDNNFLASSKKHFNKVIDSLKVFSYVDFNQGLEARKFTPTVADRLSELKYVKIRFAFDKLSDEKYVVDAINLAKKKGFRGISCYVLCGFRETPKEALYRVKILRSLSIEIFSMRFQSLDCLRKNEFIAKDKGWTNYDLIRFTQYWRGGKDLWKGSFDDFDRRKEKPVGLGLVPSLKDGRKERWGKE